MNVGKRRFWCHWSWRVFCPLGMCWVNRKGEIKLKSVSHQYSASVGDVCSVTTNSNGMWSLTCHGNNEFCHFPCCASATAHFYSLCIQGVYTQNQYTIRKKMNLGLMWPDQRLCLHPENLIIQKNSIYYRNLCAYTLIKSVIWRLVNTILIF